MGKFKNLKISCLFFTMLIAVVACNEKDNSLKVNSDVVFWKKKIENQDVYGVAYYLQANQGLDSVTVTLPSEQVVKLKQHETSTYLFWKEPADAEFTPIEPETGVYLFKVASKKGEYLEIVEEQDFFDLPFIEIDSTGFDDSSGKKWYYVRWKDIKDADAYEVMLLNLSGKVIFNGITFPATEKHDYYISQFHITGVWDEEPKKGQRYNLKTNAIKYDDPTDKNNPYNTQIISESVREITWQLE